MNKLRAIWYLLRSTSWIVITAQKDYVRTYADVQDTDRDDIMEQVSELYAESHDLQIEFSEN